MVALSERVGASGACTRVFGHPARMPANRDALAAAALGTAMACLSWPLPGLTLWFGAIGLTGVLLAALGVSLWPRQPAWTLIVGVPGSTIRHIDLLALDVRRPRRWLAAVAALPAAVCLLTPGTPWALGAGLVAVAVCTMEVTRARELSIDAVVDWVLARAGRDGVLVLVSTAGSAYGEGVAAVVDWFGLRGGELSITIDEEGDSGVRRRLADLGIGGGADVVAGEHARG
ncbi:MAG: hypothetical protein EXR71_19760 [Myxococcales bacterium]|nr:hypothetical protein [Myxococcales bacterium]